MTAGDDELGLETPAVDHLEQHRSLGDDPGDEEPGDGGVLPQDIEADEADVLEQAIPVPADDEYPENGGQ